eukprot:1072631-Amphidinium_carterae.1
MSQKNPNGSKWHVCTLLGWDMTLADSSADLIALKRPPTNICSPVLPQHIHRSGSKWAMEAC